VADLIFANFATSTLAGPISNSAVALNVQAGAGALFAHPSAGQYFVGVLVDEATGLDHEVIWVTNVSTDTFTIVRAQEGTSALSWLAGDIVANRWTAGQADTMVQQDELQEQATNYAADSGTANAISVTLDPVPPSLAALVGSPIRIKKAAAANTGATTIAVNGLAATPLLLTNNTALTAGVLSASGILEAIFDGTNFQLISDSVGSGSLAAIGYWRFPSGLIIQWTNANIPSGVLTSVPLPIAFPTACLFALASYQNAVPPTTGAIGVNPATTSTLGAYNSSPGTNGCNFLAIGH